jgi:hypothetical protein
MILVIKNVKKNKKIEELIQPKNEPWRSLLSKNHMFLYPIIRKLVVFMVMVSESENVLEQDPNNTNELDSSPGANIEDVSFQPDIFDKRYWNSLDSKHVDILAHKGPKRDL